ncbi:MAG TPA: hypothetical protein VFG29_12335, partial [Syntrophales bacterium]|nr:hypothetical protein [Syntrophales bacterium]
MKWKTGEIKRYTTPFLLFFVVLVLTYSNSFNCSWHFDDYLNIVENPGIQIKALSWEGIEKGLHGIAG